MTDGTPQTDLAAVIRRLQQLATASQVPGREPRRLFYMLEITEACSLACPVCYASATPGHGRHLSVEHVLALGRRVLEDGGRFVQLIGGEPAEHPRLLEIVRGLRKAGLSPVLTTNGIRLGREPGFATELRRAGLHKANIQFDTLDAATSTVMRGQDLVKVKQRAVANAAAGGLRVGLIATMCDRNVREAGDILRFAMGFTPRLSAVTFQCLIEVGRFPAAMRTVGRAEILHALLCTPGMAGAGLSPEDIMPPPQYAPWRALTHSACSALLYLCRDAGSETIQSLGRDVDMEQFHAALHAASDSGDGFWNRMLRPLATLWRCARPGRRLTAIRRMASLASGRGNRHMCVVNVDGNMHGDGWDGERLRRCPSCFVTLEGFINPCARLCAITAGTKKTGGAP